MGRFNVALAVMMVAAAVSGAAAQGLTAAVPERAPRVEVGGGLTWLVRLPDPTSAVACVDARAGVALSRTWALEGGVNLHMDDGDYLGTYRIQARWRFYGAENPGGLQAHLLLGAGGAFGKWSSPGYDYTNYATGQVIHVPGHSDSSVTGPSTPGIGLGVQKILGPHLALRADLVAAVFIGDEFGFAFLMPTVSVSIPFGRYPTSRAR
jgi:hypothetical protein